MNVNVIQLKKITSRVGKFTIATSSATKATTFTVALVSAPPSLIELSLQVPHIVLEGVAVALEGIVLGLKGVVLGLKGVELDLEGVALALEGVALALEGIALGLEVDDCLIASGNGGVTHGHFVLRSDTLIAGGVEVGGGSVEVVGEGVDGGLHVAGVDLWASSREGNICVLRHLSKDVAPRLEVIEWDSDSGSACDRIETSRVKPWQGDAVADVVGVIHVVSDGQIGEQIAVLLVGRIGRPGVGVVEMANEIPNVNGDLVKVHSSITHEPDEGMRILGSGDVVRSNTMPVQQLEQLLAIAAGASVAEFHTEQTVLITVRRLNLWVVVVVARECDWSWSCHGDVLFWFAV